MYAMQIVMVFSFHLLQCYGRVHRYYAEARWSIRYRKVKCPKDNRQVNKQSPSIQIKPLQLLDSRQHLFIPDKTMPEQSFSICLLKCYPESLILLLFNILKIKKYPIYLPRCLSQT
jgi:hypothetical protein